jgi:hypothetical protein
MEAKKATMLEVEAESGGPDAELAKLEEEGIESAVRLKELYAPKRQPRSESRR